MIFSVFSVSNSNKSKLLYPVFYTIPNFVSLEVFIWRQHIYAWKWILTTDVLAKSRCWDEWRPCINCLQAKLYNSSMMLTSVKTGVEGSIGRVGYLIEIIPDFRNLWSTQLLESCNSNTTLNLTLACLSPGSLHVHIWKQFLVLLQLNTEKGFSSF